MKNKELITNLAIIGGLFLTWRFLIKPKIAEMKARKQIETYEKFDEQRELIAGLLPQENEVEINTENENII